MPRKPAPKTLKTKATRLHSLIVRSRGFCENCGERRPDLLQCAHIVSRRFAWTRTDETNAFCLCAKCHWHFTNWPMEFAKFVDLKIGRAAYEALRAKAQRMDKFDWAAEYERLEALWARLEAA